MSATVRAVIVGFGCGPIWIAACRRGRRREAAGVEAETVVVLPPGEGAPDLGRRARVLEVGPS